MELTARMWTSARHAADPVAITAHWSTARVSTSLAATRAAVRADSEWTQLTPRVFLSTRVSRASTRVTAMPRASPLGRGLSSVLATISSLGMAITVNVSQHILQKIHSGILKTSQMFFFKLL